MKKFLIVLGVLALLLAVVAWSRMGGIEIVKDEAALAQAAANTATPAEFSIVAYNVQCRPWFDETEIKFQYMPPVLNPYDIITFQELFKEHDQLWAGFDHPVKIYHSALKHPGKIVGSGLGILGRFPVDGVEAMHYSTAGDFQNKPASKGILMAHFKVHGLPVDVYTTHMEAGSDRKEPAMISRRKQGEELVAFVKEHSPPENAVIFLGDFNLRFPEEGAANADIAAGRYPENYDKLTRVEIMQAINAQLGFKDLCMEMNKQHHDGVDHVLYRDGAKVKLTALSYQHDGPEFYSPDGAPLSDHEPVIARFRVAPADAPTPAPESGS